MTKASLGDFLDFERSYTEERTLRCPICACEYNHHGLVEVFERPNGEDSATIVLNSETVQLSPSQENPSSRRNALRVHIRCESDHHWYLDIIQHKGATFLQVGISDA